MKTRTFEEVWRDIEKLKGSSLPTLVNGVENIIIDVNECGIIRRSEVHNQERPVDKSAFARVWRDLTEKGYCKISNRWKIACACLARLPEVYYSEDTRTIWLSENKHEFGKLVEKTQ